MHILIRPMRLMRPILCLVALFAAGLSARASTLVPDTLAPRGNFAVVNGTNVSPGTVPFARSQQGLGVEPGFNVPLGNLTNSSADIYRNSGNEWALEHLRGKILAGGTPVLGVIGDSRSTIPATGSSTSWVLAASNALYTIGVPTVWVDFSVSGTTSLYTQTNANGHGMTNILTFNSTTNFDAIVVAGQGFNDAYVLGYTASQTETNLTNIVAYLQTNGMGPLNCSWLFLGPTTKSDSVLVQGAAWSGETWIESLVPVFKRTARNFVGAWLDLYSSAAEARGTNVTWMSTDFAGTDNTVHIHPTNDVQRLWGVKVQQLIAPFGFLASPTLNIGAVTMTGNATVGGTVNFADGSTQATSATNVAPTGGTVNRVLNQKLGDYISVLDFGGKADSGTTDNSIAIEAFTNAFPNGGAIYFPAGVYALNITNFSSNIRIYGASVAGTYGSPNGTNGTVFIPYNKAYPIWQNGSDTNYVQQVLLENISFDGDFSGTGRGGFAAIVLTGGSANFRLNGTRLTHFTNTIISLGGTNFPSLFNRFEHGESQASAYTAINFAMRMPPNGSQYNTTAELNHFHLNGANNGYNIEVDGTGLFATKLYLDNYGGHAVHLMQSAGTNANLSLGYIIGDIVIDSASSSDTLINVSGTNVYLPGLVIGTADINGYVQFTDPNNSKVQWLPNAAMLPYGSGSEYPFVQGTLALLDGAGATAGYWGGWNQSNIVYANSGELIVSGQTKSTLSTRLPGSYIHAGIGQAWIANSNNVTEIVAYAGGNITITPDNTILYLSATNAQFEIQNATNSGQYAYWQIIGSKVYQYPGNGVDWQWEGGGDNNYQNVVHYYSPSGGVEVGEWLSGTSPGTNAIRLNGTISANSNFVFTQPNTGLSGAAYVSATLSTNGTFYATNLVLGGGAVTGGTTGLTNSGIESVAFASITNYFDPSVTWYMKPKADGSAAWTGDDLVWGSGGSASWVGNKAGMRAGIQYTSSSLLLTNAYFYDSGRSFCGSYYPAAPLKSFLSITAGFPSTNANAQEWIGFTSDIPASTVATNFSGATGFYLFGDTNGATWSAIATATGTSTNIATGIQINTNSFSLSITVSDNYPQVYVLFHNQTPIATNNTIALSALSGMACQQATNNANACTVIGSYAKFTTRNYFP